MAQSNSMSIFLACSAVTMVAVIAIPSGNTESEAAPTASSRSAIALQGRDVASTADPTAAAPPLAELTARVSGMDWGRDPFERPGDGYLVSAPKPTPKIDPAVPRLTGISNTASGFMAILGDQIVEPGIETRSGFRVLSIDRESVTLSRNGEQLTLGMSEGSR